MSALLGAILLKRNRLDEAETTLLDVIAMAPTFARPHQDLAILYMNREDFRSAVEYFRRATGIDPGLATAYSGLSHALTRLGENDTASEAFNRYVALTPDDSLARIIALQQNGELKKARIACGRLLAREPENRDAMRRLALISAEEGQYSEAQRMFHHLHQRAPESVVSLMDLANNYLEQHNYVGAIDWLQRAVNLKPDSAEILLKLAWSQLLVGKPDRALEAYSSCLALDSGILNTQKQSAMLGRGNALRVLGRGAEAISAYQSCLGEEGIFANACWSLASMRTYEFSDSELDRMMTQCARKDNSSRVTTHLDFAIGKALDDREEYGAAWARYVSGNARQRNETRFDGVDFESNIDDLIGTYTAEFCNRKPVAPADDAISIFILGLPRSGSTLLEQILASHSQVEATTELPYLREFATPLNRNSSPANSFAVTDLQEDAIKALGEKYLAATSAHRLERKPWFIDKLPANFPYVGFIHRVLPQAIIIDARRNPLDTCIANFRQLYAQGKEFSYDLVELSEMYLQYVRLMEHWDTVLPGRVLTMRYEAVVDDTQQQIAQMLKHCGLEWEVACLDFRSTSRTFSTASSEQVRQPIYTSSIGYWRHYEENLTDLIESLESVIAGSQTDAV